MFTKQSNGKLGQTSQTGLTFGGKSWETLPVMIPLLKPASDTKVSGWWFQTCFINGRSPGSNWWRYVSTICLTIFCGDIPLHRPYIDLIYGRYLQSIGTWVMAIFCSGLGRRSSEVPTCEASDRSDVTWLSWISSEWVDPCGPQRLGCRFCYLLGGFNLPTLALWKMFWSDFASWDDMTFPFLNGKSLKKSCSKAPTSFVTLW